MTDRKEDDAVAKAKRAARIHAQIEAAKGKTPPPPRPGAPLSPREFIHRKMNERDEEK